MDRTKWSVWRGNVVACFFCNGDIKVGDAYRLEVFYVSDIVHSLVDEKERHVWKPVSKRVHAVLHEEAKLARCQIAIAIGVSAVRLTADSAQEQLAEAAIVRHLLLGITRSEELAHRQGRLPGDV